MIIMKKTAIKRVLAVSLALVSSCGSDADDTATTTKPHLRPDHIQAASESCGFNNYSHFYRLFVHETGLSPVKWREQARKKGVSYVG